MNILITGGAGYVGSIYYMPYFEPKYVWVSYVNAVLACCMAYLLNRRLIQKVIKYGWSAIFKIKS